MSPFDRILRTIQWLAITAWLMPTVVFARGPDDAPPLPPPPPGRTAVVSNVEQLLAVAARAPSNATILLRKGEYRLSRPIHFRGVRNLTIRGQTNRFDDVVIRGAGMGDKSVYHGILADGVDGLLIADLTIGWVGYHPIAISPDCNRVRVYHCRLVDAGEQFVKASSDRRGGGADNGIVEYSRMEYTNQGPANGYTNGVDVHGGKNWIIRHNEFRNIRTPRGAEYKFVPAVLMWNGARDTVCESNTFINCDRGIAFGLVQREGFDDHRGGVIRNNFIYVEKGQVPNADAGIFVASADTQIAHNTVVLQGAYPNSIEVRWPLAKGVKVVNNLTDGNIVARDGASITSAGNVSTAKPAWFANLGSRPDLHLVEDVPGVPVAIPLAEDWDGDARPRQMATPGADEPK